MKSNIFRRITIPHWPKLLMVSCQEREREREITQPREKRWLTFVFKDDLSAKWINQGFDVILNTTNKPFISHEQHAESFDTGISMPSMEAVDALDSDTRSVYDLIDDCGKDGATLPLLKVNISIVIHIHHDLQHIYRVNLIYRIAR